MLHLHRKRIPYPGGFPFEEGQGLYAAAYFFMGLHGGFESPLTCGGLHDILNRPAKLWLGNLNLGLRHAGHETAECTAHSANHTAHSHAAGPVLHHHLIHHLLLRRYGQITVIHHGFHLLVPELTVSVPHGQILFCPAAAGLKHSRLSVISKHFLLEVPCPGIRGVHDRKDANIGEVWISRNDAVADSVCIAICQRDHPVRHDHLPLHLCILGSRLQMVEDASSREGHESVLIGGGIDHLDRERRE